MHYIFPQRCCNNEDCQTFCNLQKLVNNDLNDFVNKVYSRIYYFSGFKCRKSNANLALQLFQKSNAVLHYFPYFQIVMHYTAVLQNKSLKVFRLKAAILGLCQEFYFFMKILGRAQKKIWRPILRPFEAILSSKSLFEGVPRGLKCSYFV